MPRYIVRKIYETIVEVEVFANSESEAEEKALELDGTEVDSMLVDMYAIEQEEDDE